MADLTADPCCSETEQVTCCEPSAKAECCSPEHASGSCGCSAGAPDARGQAASTDELRETVRRRYAAAARAVAAGEAPACGCAADGGGLQDQEGTQVFGDALYGPDETAAAPDAAVAASLGCGVPTAVADLREGETVLDLGSGAGADVLISAGRVGETGKAIGVDMTNEMLDLARRNAAQAGARNVEFVKGTLEELPLPDASVDVVISNCVINLSGDKHQVLREAARVLRPGGRFAVSDVIADDGMDAQTRADMVAWTGCVAGALTRDQFATALTDAGLTDVEIRPTHRVHEHAESAIIARGSRSPRSEARAHAPVGWRAVRALNCA